MELLIVFGLCLLNLGISWLNCWSVGGMWAESKFVGGWMRVLAWCGFTQAVVGFSSVIVLVLTWLAIVFHLLPPKFAGAALQLWYLMVIIPALGTGLLITIHSLITAWRSRSMLDIGCAAWNTFAMAQNLAGAVEGVPDAWKGVSELMDGDSDSAPVAIVLAIVALAIGGGVLITSKLVSYYGERAGVPQALPA